MTDKELNERAKRCGIKVKRLDFIGFPDYIISNNGLIGSLKSKKWLKAFGSEGYCHYVNLSHHGQKEKVIVSEIYELAFPEEEN